MLPNQFSYSNVIYFTVVITWKTATMGFCILTVHISTLTLSKSVLSKSIRCLCKLGALLLDEQFFSSIHLYLVSLLLGLVLNSSFGIQVQK